MWRIQFDTSYQNVGIRRNYRERINPFDVEDNEFLDRHRLPKDAVLNLCDFMNSRLERFTHRSQSLSVETQVCVALRYYGVGGFMREIGDLYGISEMSAGRCVHTVSSALSSEIDRFISWPSSISVPNIQEKFYTYSRGFPQIIGVIDGCHIPIHSPSLPITESAFVNRKGWHSINTQIVCDSDFRILDLNAMYPGSNHDSFILRQSSVYERFQENRSTELLLGDSGYPALPWLMTPILRPSSTMEERYNSSHKHTRNIIERCNGILKSRFRCLTRDITFKPSKASKVIGACACLHNYAVNLNIPDFDTSFEEHDSDEPQQSIHVESNESHARQSSLSGQSKRNEIVMTCFNQLA